MNINNIQQGIDNIHQIKNLADEGFSNFNPNLLFEAGLNYNVLQLETVEFDEYLSMVNYKANYPEYWQAFYEAFQKLKYNNPEHGIYEKAFEQYLAARLIKKYDYKRIIDIACDRCPFSSIAVSKLGADYAIAQDFTTAPKTSTYLASNKKIRILIGNASDLKIDDQSLDFACLLNSWEHFQAPSDLGVIKECARILKSKGRLLIAPLYLRNKAYIETDPSVWSWKQVYDKSKHPNFRTMVPVYLRNNAQVYDQKCSPSLLGQFINEVPSLHFEITKVEIPHPSLSNNSFFILQGIKN